jgi:hypothetical protein
VCVCVCMYKVIEGGVLIVHMHSRERGGYIHTYIHTHIHTYTHTYIHTYTHTYIHTYIHTYTHTYIHTHIHTHIHTYIHTYTHTHINTYTHKYIPHTSCVLSANGLGFGATQHMSYMEVAYITCITIIDI